MDDTHTPAAAPANADPADSGEADGGERPSQMRGSSAVLDELAAADPADAPEVAEKLAAELSQELDEATAAGSPPDTSDTQDPP